MVPRHGTHDALYSGESSVAIGDFSIYDDIGGAQGD
jgi:hypothetical protein